jgi:hypothetical protein
MKPLQLFIKSGNVFQGSSPGGILQRASRVVTFDSSDQSHLESLIENWFIGTQLKTRYEMILLFIAPADYTAFSEWLDGYCANTHDISGLVNYNFDPDSISIGSSSGGGPIWRALNANVIPEMANGVDTLGVSIPSGPSIPLYQAGCALDVRLMVRAAIDPSGMAWGVVDSSTLFEALIRIELDSTWTVDDVDTDTAGFWNFPVHNVGYIAGVNPDASDRLLTIHVIATKDQLDNSSPLVFYTLASGSNDPVTMMLVTVKDFGIAVAEALEPPTP